MMDETLKKMTKTGYGVGLLSLVQAKKVVKQVQKELNLNDAESKELAKELMKSSHKASKEMVAVAGKHMDKALVSSGLVKKSELPKVKKILKKRVTAKAKTVHKKVKKVVKRRSAPVRKQATSKSKVAVTRLKKAIRKATGKK